MEKGASMTAQDIIQKHEQNMITVHLTMIDFRLILMPYLFLSDSNDTGHFQFRIITVINFLLTLYSNLLTSVL